MIKSYILKTQPIKNIIHWCDLRDHTVIKIGEAFQKHLLDFIFKKNSSKKELAQILGIDRHMLNLYATFRSNFSVKNLKILTNFAGISFKEAEKYIIEIGRKRTKIKNPRLPFRLDTPDGIALRSIVNSEGHIPQQRGSSMHIRVPELEMLQAAIKFAKNIFGEFEVQIKPTKGKHTYEIFFPAPIADALEMSGLARGRKSIKNLCIPRDIIRANKALQRVYLQWSFACEMECSGKVIKITRYVDVSDILDNSFLAMLPEGVIRKNAISRYIAKKLAKKPPNLLIGESLMLKRFNIFRQPYFTSLWKAKNGRVSAAWTIPITCKSEIELLLLYSIGIPLSHKAQAVETVLKSYKSYNPLNRETFRALTRFEK